MYVLLIRISYKNRANPSGATKSASRYGGSILAAQDKAPGLGGLLEEKWSEGRLWG